MGPGPHRKRPLIHGLLPEPWLRKSLFNYKIKASYAIFPSSRNKNAHCKPCVLPPTFSHAETCHHWCQNLNKSSTKIPTLLCHLMLVYSALPKGYVSSAKESKDKQVTVGVHFSPEEFLNEAVRLCHPTEHNSLFPKEVRANIAHLSSKTVHQVAQERAEEVKRWVALGKELATKSEI